MSEIFVSTGTSSEKSLDTAGTLFTEGHNQIELSGGAFDPLWEDKALKLMDLGCNFSLHNYFPPPAVPFVLNLGHWDRHVRLRSIAMATESIVQSYKLGAKIFAVHSPFALDIKSNELGGELSQSKAVPKELVMELFLDSIATIKNVAKPFGVRLYLENTPLSLDNWKSVGEESLLGASSQEVVFLAERAGLSVLVDFGHIKVSSKSLGLDPRAEAESMLEHSDYVHVSENNSLLDEHSNFTKSAWFLPILKKWSKQIKTATLEVGITNKESLDLSKSLLQEALG